jgi:thiol-disulfide isomerase/thioredoxin
MSDRNLTLAHGWAIGALFCSLVLAGPGRAAQAPGGDAKAGPPASPKAETVLRRMSEFYKKAQSCAVDVVREQKIGPVALNMTFTVAIQRPNRFAIHSTPAGPTAFDVVSDGKKLYVSLAQFQKYTESDAPNTIEEAVGKDLILRGILQFLLVNDLYSADPYAKLMEGVKTATNTGQEKLDGAPAYHLKFTLDQVDWEMWVAAEGDPLVRRLVVDLTKAMASSPFAGQFKNQKAELTENFKNWRIDRGVDEKSFAFEPPKGAQKVESFLAGLGGGGKPPTSPLVGKPAPDVNLKRLDQGEFRLKDHRDTHVVMIDFWATWCGPCVQEMPILAEVAEAYKEKGVVFCAINEQEKPEDINKFLKDKKLAITVALDSDGAVGGAYRAEAIPQLVLIDKKGIVQSVHVGYDPAVKATLRKELDALLAGKDLAKEALKPAATKLEGLEQAWSASGAYSSVASDPTGHTIYAIEAGRQCNVLDADGKTTRTFRLPQSGQAIARFARLARDSQDLLTFAPWGRAIVACKGDGTKLWEEASSQGIDDVWAADLDGDGVDEVIAGYNGSTGLHLFSADAKRIWQRTDIGNVWHVAAGDLDGDGKPEVVTTSAQGKVHVFAPKDGTPLRTLDAGLYANMIRTAPGRAIASSTGDLVLVIGTASGGEAMTALAGDGKTLWTLKLPTDAQHCDSLAVSPDGTYAAAGLRGGRVCVVELGRGRIVGQVASQAMTPIVAWASRANSASPLVLVATGREIHAFRIKPVAATADNRQP